MPAALRACLAWLLLYGQASAAISSLGLHSQQHPRLRSAPHATARTAEQPEAVLPGRGPCTAGAAAPDVGMAEFLGSCGYTQADLPGKHAAWHTASSACSILGKLERLIFVGDSMTRQVQPPAPPWPASQSCSLSWWPPGGARAARHVSALIFCYIFVAA